MVTTLLLLNPRINPTKSIWLQPNFFVGIMFPCHKSQYKQTPNQMFRYDAFGDHLKETLLVIAEPSWDLKWHIAKYVVPLQTHAQSIICSYNTYYGNTPFPKADQTGAKDRCNY